MMIWNDSDGDGPVTVNVVDRTSLLDDLAQRFESRQGFSIATINLDHVVKLARDRAFRKAYAAHSHVTADGNPIVWLEKLSGRTDISLVPGSELIAPVAALAAEKNVPVALLGATDASLKLSADALEAQNPGLKVVATLAPPMGFDPESDAAGALIEDLRTSGARLVFLALGAPKQERFAARAATALPEAGFLSIGAGLDFISGEQTRAPVWVRKIAAEWLWRLLGNPKRLAARYGACILALPGLIFRALKIRRAA